MLRKELQEIKSTARDLRSFGLVVGGVLLIIAGWFFVSAQHDFRPIAIAGGALVLLGWLEPHILRPLQRPWMMLAVVLGYGMTRVILFILFFALFTPIAVIMGLTGQRQLDLRFRPKQSVKSYWNRRDVQRSTREVLERQY